MVIDQECDNCHRMQTHPDYLWREVTYRGPVGGGTRVVCPACYEWARNHPAMAKTIQMNKHEEQLQNPVQQAINRARGQIRETDAWIARKEAEFKFTRLIAAWVAQYVALSDRYPDMSSPGARASLAAWIVEKGAG